MQCPICNSDNYDFVDVSDYDELDSTLHFKCLGKCRKDFYGVYSFLFFKDEDGNEINGEY